MSNRRYLEDLILSDALADRKIAFISGPRQIGKTTLAKSILKNLGQPSNYFSWDDDEFKLIWNRNPKQLLENRETVVFDEIHKDLKWKNRLKGLYDLFNESNRFIVTGSARLNYYRKSGDSLQGRYIPYRLHPFTLGENAKLKPPPELNWFENSTPPQFELDSLLALGGFPEPLLKGSQLKASRWRKLYRERLVREDIRDLQMIREFSSLDILSILLPDKVASQLSYESIRQDLSVTHDTIIRWFEIFEAVYYCYRLRPYSTSIKNSLKKEPKVFLYDWARVDKEGARFENLIASHLLKNVELWNDAAMGDFALYYIRDKQKREVDFFITRDNQPWLLLEVKSGQDTATSSLLHYHQLLSPKFSFQLVREKRKERRKTIVKSSIEIITAERFLSALN